MGGMIFRAAKTMLPNRLDQSMTTTPAPGDMVDRLRACANGIGSFKSDKGDYGICDDAADRIEYLEKRLEVQPEWGEECDGIACRDETIKGLDKRIEALEAARLTAYEQGRADERAAVVAWLTGPRKATSSTSWIADAIEASAHIGAKD